MPVLPLTFPGRGSIAIGKGGSIPEGGRRVPGSGEGMGRNMGRGHRLTCGTGSGTGRIIILYRPCSGMGGEGGTADVGHPELTRTHPLP